jgi:HD superfamily phosphohydrolase
MSDTQRDYFQDPIWGFFDPPTEVIKVLDTHEVQRLSKVAQLSFVNLVYRSANHTRLEHSLGVTNLVDKAMNRFYVDNKAWSDEESRKIYIANWEKLKKFAEVCALIHDIGHGPFSHFVEPFLQWTGQEIKTNEEIGEAIIHGKYERIDRELAPKDAVFLAEVLEDLSRKLSFSVDDFAMFVTSDEKFKEMYKGSLRPHLFVRKLISSPIDMDRLDFLNRDCYFTGLKGGVDAYSIIQNLSLIKQGQTLDLALEQDGIFYVEALLSTRDIMYATVYHHPVNRWALAMVLRAAYKLYKDYSISPEYMLRQTDAGFLETLKEFPDGYVHGIAQRIEERRPYYRVFDLEFSYANLENLPTAKDVLDKIQKLERNPIELLETEETVEDELALKRIGSEEVDVIIDLPYPLKFVEAEVEVKLKKPETIVPLKKVSDLARYIGERSKQRRWFLNVFTNIPPFKSEYKQVVKLVKRELNIPLGAHPGIYAI